MVSAKASRHPPFDNPLQVGNTDEARRASEMDGFGVSYAGAQEGFILTRDVPSSLFDPNLSPIPVLSKSTCLLFATAPRTFCTVF